MSVETEFEKKTLDILDAERRLKLGRTLAKSIYPSLWVNALLAAGVWVWNHDYIQFLAYGILVIPSAIILMLQPVFEARGRSPLWAALFSMYTILIIFAIPFLIPETSIAVAASYPTIFLAIGLVSGRKSLLVGMLISIVGFIFNAFIGQQLASVWFPRLDTTISDVITQALGAFAIITTGIVLFVFVSGQEKLYRQAQMATIHVQESDRAKLIFLSAISQKIYKPAINVAGTTSLLLDMELTSSQNRIATMLHDNGNILLSTVNDILDFSKIETGTIALEQKPFALRESVGRVMVLLSKGILQKGIELSCLIDADVPYIIRGDEGRINRVLLNLLDNSIKFTETGQVDVTIKNEHLSEDSTSCLHFVVQDTGIGIPREKINQLFELQSSSQTSINNGTGLGLVMCKRLVELMGGKIWAESSGIPGQGSSFHFTIRVEKMGEGNA